MALLVDGSVSQIEDLKAYDSGVLGVASGESIDVNSKLDVALAEIAEEVEDFLRCEDRGRLEQVRVSLALRRWHTLKTLEAIYRDAYFSQLNDRYGERWKHYQKLAADEQRRAFECGIELVLNPVNRPQSVTVTIGDGTLAASTYWVQATVLDATGRESAPSPVQVASSAVPHSLSVALPYATDGIAYWNVFAGTAEDEMARQNATPLAVNAAWVLSTGTLTPGAPPSTGQAADIIVRRTNRRRG